MQTSKNLATLARQVLRVLFISLLVIATFAQSTQAAEPPAIDRAARGFFGGTNRIGKFHWFGNHVMGAGTPGLLLGLGFWGYGSWKDHPQEKYAGIAQVETVIATGVTVAILKEISNRTRPDESDSLSFPSAHVAYAFATASVLNAFYGPKVGVPVYALAVLTAVARMQDNRHWLTDTLGGAAVGIGFGLLFSNMNKNFLAHDEADRALHSSSVQAAPMVGPGILGGTLTFTF
jgi:membrane-associated phospholipid phosphatase